MTQKTTAKVFNTQLSEPPPIMTSKVVPLALIITSLTEKPANQH